MILKHKKSEKETSAESLEIEDKILEDIYSKTYNNEITWNFYLDIYNNLKFESDKHKDYCFGLFINFDESYSFYAFNETDNSSIRITEKRKEFGKLSYLYNTLKNNIPESKIQKRKNSLNSLYNDLVSVPGT